MKAQNIKPFTQANSTFVVVMASSTVSLTQQNMQDRFLAYPSTKIASNSLSKKDPFRVKESHWLKPLKFLKKTQPIL
jgi:ABC-type Fe3+ transport system substrate-binding protein